MSKRRMAGLACPQAKRNAPPPCAPLPVPLATLTGVPASNNYWSVYRGKLVRHNTIGPEGRRVTVLIENEGEARTIQENGCFGLLVEGGGWVDQARVELEDWGPGADNTSQDAENEDENDYLKPIKLDNEGLVEEIETGCEDSHEESNDSPRNWSELKDQSVSEDDAPVVEPAVLHLDLCEAFYLSYALGCLTVEDTTMLSLLGMWQLFRKLEPDFPARYRVYHHYRAKGWVVRSGYCFGADWALYKLGPAQYHATYTLRVEVVDRLTGEVVEKDSPKPLTWGDLLAQTRVAVTVKKDPLIARVEIRGDFRNMDSPHCLGEMSVTTYRARRWVAGDHRWNVKPKVPVEMKVVTSFSEKAGNRGTVIVLD